MSSGGSKAPAPDPQIGQAAIMQAELGKEFLEFSKGSYSDYMDRQAVLDEKADQIYDQQLEASKNANQWALEDRERQLGVFRPLEDQFIAEAKEWGSEANQEAQAGAARAGVLDAGKIAQESRARQSAAMGINPTSGRYAGVERSADTTLALGAAGAANNARQTVKKEGMALLGSAVDMGKGLGTSATTALGLGVSSGSAALGTQAGAQQASLAGNGIMQSGYGTGMQGYANQANILTNLYGQQLDAWKTEQNQRQQATQGLASGIGSIAGLGLGFAMKSDENAKHDKKPVKGALDAVRSMPVEEWTYNEGEGDGGTHIGPYAQDFQKATGKGDGKSINVIDAIGVTMGAVQELAGTVDKLADTVGSQGIARRKPQPAARRAAASPARGIERRAA
jgi:hypothetical protein